MIFRDMTIAIIGTHGSGKSTIGTKLANLLGCRFDPELGTILRDQDSLVTSGHLHGNGSSTKTSQDEQQDWDDRIHSAEVKRDEESSGNRVVETWHLGNKSWYQLRERQFDHRRLERYTSAVANHRETSLVLMVQLALETPSIMVRRRKQHAKMRERLPMENEEEECKELHQALQGEHTSFHIVARELGIPLLQISNGHDGKDAIEETLRAILSFMQQHYHRQVVTAPKSSIMRQRISSNNF
jgi:ABC-type oligopeptide transport system ATPase subunit